MVRTAKAPALPRQTEAEFQQQVVTLAKACGWRVVHHRISLGTPHGWPDLVLLHPGRKRALFWELKSATGTASLAQNTMIADLTACGLDADILRPGDWDHIEAVLTGMA